MAVIGVRGCAGSASRRIAPLLLPTIALLGPVAAFAQAPSAASGTMVEAIARQLAPEYAGRQVQRLAAVGDRDSLIAAALVGMPNDSRSAAADGHDEVLKRLVTEHADDELATYTAALACNVQNDPCTHPEFQAALLKVAPANALHFLLLPRGARLEASHLHQAAAAGRADTHLTALLGIVHKALANQPALATSEGSADADALALSLALRRNEVNSVPWPNLIPVTELCTAEAAARQEAEPELHADCSMFGFALFNDASNSLVTRNHGGTLVRRFQPESSAAAEAVGFRRQYVWISERREPDSAAKKELLFEEMATVGEWEAVQRQAERAGVGRVPADDWLPKDPRLLLLPEEQAKSP